MRRDSRAFSRSVFWRDVREVAASFLVAGVFGKIAYDAQAEGAVAWPAWTAAILPLLVAVVFLVDRAIQHERSAPRGDNIVVEIERAAAAVRHQIWLLRNVLWWYILPLSVCSLLIGLQVALYGPAEMPEVARWIIGALVLLPTGLVDWWVWKLNQNAVRDQLEPQLAELERHRRELADAL